MWVFIRTFLWPAHPTAPMSFSIFHTLFNKYIKYIKNYVVWSVHTRCIYTQILLFLWFASFFFYISVFSFRIYVYWIVFFFGVLFYIRFYTLSLYFRRVALLFFQFALSFSSPRWLLLYSCCCYYNEFYIKSFMCRDVLKVGRRFIVAICRSFWFEYCCCCYY